jgi:hypothetical protein
LGFEDSLNLQTVLEFSGFFDSFDSGERMEEVFVELALNEWICDD